MRDDFAVLILTHGRPNNVRTVKSLMAGGYTGKWHIVIDNEDKSAEEYRTVYDERVIVFNKQKYIDLTDTADNFDEHRAIVYARNASFDIAESLGVKYFLMLDDDYVAFDYRMAKDDKLVATHCKQLDRLFEAYVEFLETSGAITVTMAQGGDFIGGVGNANFRKGLLRKAMNTFFCSTERRFQFVGTQNEDVSTYTRLGSVGNLLFTVTGAMIIQLPTQKNAGGMSEVYRESGTYVKSFYTVMQMPSCVTVNIMQSNHPRIHHNVHWENTVPKILNECWRKEG